MKNRCYLCNRELSTQDFFCSEKEFKSKTHGEHIIHNAILGRLVSNKILCEECGSSYSSEDKDFTSLFAAFVSRLEELGAYKRRSTNPVTKDGYLYDPVVGLTSKIVQERNGKIFPKDQANVWYEIDDVNKKVYVCANIQRTKNFKKQFLNTASQYSDYEFVSRDYSSMGKGIATFFSEGNPNFNDSFKKGFVKIALEYALHVGVNRTNMSNVLQIQSDGSAIITYDSVDMIPYYPFDNREKCYENMKWNAGNAPYHMLRLFDIDSPENKRWLVCFVDLFSTFQYYVVLNKNYRGEQISKYYSQRILAKEESGKQLPSEFDYIDYLDDLCFYEEDFRKYTIDCETNNKLPTLFQSVANKDDLIKYTYSKFEQLRSFLWR